MKLFCHFIFHLFHNVWLNTLDLLVYFSIKGDIQVLCIKGVLLIPSKMQFSAIFCLPFIHK